VSFVLDNSVALTWCFEDERTPATTALLEQVGESGALAPGLWPLEALNGLLVAERRGRLDTSRRQRLAGFLRALPVSLDDETASQAWTATMGLAERLLSPPMTLLTSNWRTATASRLPPLTGI
jgi:hypothetical protein